MPTLQEMLNQRTHRDLEMIARAHKLPFTRREPKSQGLTQLSAALQGGHYEKALTSEHMEALRALVVAGDWLPLPLFTHHFGEIRLYKPWHWAARFFWKRPVSPAEKLWHLGMVEIDTR